MKAFLLVGILFSAFLIILGVTSRKTAGDVLSSAVLVAGGFVFVFVAVIWVLSYIKEKREKENKF